MPLRQPPFGLVLIPAGQLRVDTLTRLRASPTDLVDGTSALIAVRRALAYDPRLATRLRALAAWLIHREQTLSDGATLHAIEGALASGRLLAVRLREPEDAPPAARPPELPQADLEERFAAVLRRVPPHLPAAVREEFAALLTPETLAILVGTLAVWAASHAFGVGAVIDVVLAIAAAIFLGWAAIRAAEALFEAITLTLGARTADEPAIERAAQKMAEAIAIIGVTAFLALIARVARRVGRGRRPAPREEAAAGSAGRTAAITTRATAAAARRGTDAIARGSGASAA